ncbi:MAG: type II toxin-antitoxin system RelE/ParE family toxin [Deltaproteobacteria bacterium]|jgi:toxin ParE1/3/4|nr:type II toxin-antitoxin system RelE/ParE family toxin [Deltaproteobacteria bacterium]MBT4641575.1 type II toxin-antitoxin system RelE/ParE family toxin [Deltaproteobacteria bacterium]MBT7483867.1 type II toxin-antitoxin system RelE/ParE family toxin [Candidatus Peregrinibacteria bacterium]
MNSGYRLTPAADQDITDIWRYTSETWGFVKANSYLGQLEKCLINLVDQPGLGKKRDEIREGYRSFHIGQHMIFYRQNLKKQIEVVRVLHERMDHKIHF